MNDIETRHILVADDQSHVRSALRLLLEQEPNMVVVGEAVDVTGLFKRLERGPVDVLLLDWDLPGLPIRHVLRLLQLERPSLPIIAMSSRPEARQQALQAGVAAFLSKGAPPETVLSLLAQLPQTTT
ncbi:MAG: response regulator transcription factor [Anaerolineales bacterium]|nr:response regulator transcription factor [Anaerolineales bacterium]MCB8987855.1 response regulator transcription factor [Ardenticatenaceae bacterium]